MGDGITQLLRENGVPDDKLQEVANKIVMAALLGAELYYSPGHIYMQYSDGAKSDVYKA